MLNSTSTWPVNTCSSEVTPVESVPKSSASVSTSMRDGDVPTCCSAAEMNAPYGLPVSVVIAFLSDTTSCSTSPDFALRLIPTGAENETGESPHPLRKTTTPTTPMRHPRMSILLGWFVLAGHAPDAILAIRRQPC